MQELKEAFVVWLTREKPPPQTAEYVASIVAYLCITVIMLTMTGYLFFATVCR